MPRTIPSPLTHWRPVLQGGLDLLPRQQAGVAAAAARLRAARRRQLHKAGSLAGMLRGMAAQPPTSLGHAASVLQVITSS